MLYSSDRAISSELISEYLGFIQSIVLGTNGGECCCNASAKIADGKKDGCTASSWGVVLLLAPLHQSWGVVLLLAALHQSLGVVLLLAALHQSWGVVLLLAALHQSWGVVLLLAALHQSWGVVFLSERFV